MASLTIVSSRREYTVARLAGGAPLPAWAGGAFVAVTRTPNELSIVVASARVPPEVPAEHGWRLLAVRGPLAFEEIGILAALTGTLAAVRVPVLAVSTFDTDYLLVKDGDLASAVAALRADGHQVEPVAEGDSESGL